MRKRLEMIKNNTGSALMVVMIAIAFIGILGMTVMGLAYTNLRLKTMDNQARSNFYSAESAVEEIKAGLAELSSRAIKIAHEEQLQGFTESTSSERTENLKNTYFNTLKDSIKLSTNPDKYDAAKLQSYTSKTGVTVVDFSADVATSRGAIIMDSVNATMTLKNVRVEYVNNGLLSSITTDIVIGLPSTETDTVGYLDYALISDQLVEIKTNTVANVGGNIYAGDKRDGSDSGVRVGDSSKLNQFGTGTTMISRSDIGISNSAGLVVSNGEVWTNNIVLGATTDYKVNNYNTGGNLAADVVSGPSVNINGISNVKGDLYLNARYSSAVFSNAYYGYAAGDASGAASNSAIVINGYGSSLNMSGVNELLVAGRAFVSGSGSNMASTSSDVMEGESIATKKNETIYLVNSKWLNPNIGSNPASQTKVDLATNGTVIGTRAFAEKIVKMEEDASNPGTYEFTTEFKTIFDNYLNQASPILCYYTQDPQVVYFYYNFKSEAAAADFVEAYYGDGDNSDAFKANLDIFLKGNDIKLNAAGARYEVVGAAIAKFNGRSNYTIEPAVAPSADLAIEISNKEDMYLSLQTFLKKYSGEDQSRFDMGYVASVIKEENIAADTSDMEFAYPGGATATYKMKVLGTASGTAIYLVDNEGGNPFEIREGMQNGIVIATGDVKLLATSATNPFRGLVMAMGQIYTDGGSAYYNADSDLLLGLFSAIGKDTLDRYFSEYPGGTTLTVNYSNYIGFENWVKDEDR